MELKVRKALWTDLEKSCEVEAAAVKGLRYLRDVSEEFFNDTLGEMGVVEIDGVIVGVGKYTHLYEGAVWLETLRVDPLYQGRGVGKAFYRRFFELADLQNVERMGMYTGVNNVVSKGLALKFGFQVTATYRGANLILDPKAEPPITEEQGFRLADVVKAQELLKDASSWWADHMVMNRTFYPMSRKLFAKLAEENKVYYDEEGNVLVLGARFMAETALHIGMYNGNVEKILSFTYAEALRRKVGKITIVFSPQKTEVEKELLNAGYTLEASDVIVCEWFRS